MILNQILDSIDLGLVILDRDFRIRYWNRWMAVHSGIPFNEIKGAAIFDYYPHFRNKKFLRNFRAVVTFGNHYFFPQKLYGYIFPFKPESNFVSEINYMQQSCTMGPLRNENKEIEYVYISVNDVTEAYIYETNLASALLTLLEKYVDKEEIPAEAAQSILDELLPTSSKEVLAKHGKSPKDKDTHAVIGDQLVDILSEIAGSNR
ncbi:PAS domain-containing protein [Desulfurivibrio alkaliphilus]|uniref:Putative PAS/PAC sensor protein n=1 Tax=Desulfurivibrio alkaliphilus (strain DSM 19089 / UNIQEM U267 / AHT2) TaxID=589865 RepID=D6Z1W5_DESAT|nr:PAS domain-containing protein [Desulfurivibrio alkaliphilus]ADH85540.1 putative PAS/PAC sensor protein [Desulfurivibrio alkaliphilus AHT 2]